MRTVKGRFTRWLFTAAATVAAAAGVWSVVEGMEMKSKKTAGRGMVPSIDASVPERTETATFALG